MSGTLIGVACLPFSGIDRYLHETYWQPEYVQFQNINDKGGWTDNLRKAKELLQSDKSVVAMDIVFCKTDWREKLESECGVKAQWVCAENDPLQCAENCLHSKLHEKWNGDPLAEIRLILELTAAYTYPIDATLVPIRSLRRKWLSDRKRDWCHFQKIVKKLNDAPSGLAIGRIAADTGVSNDAVKLFVDEALIRKVITRENDLIKLRRRAFLVLGPESSGTRLMTQCLIDAGCDGTAKHDQPFDKSLASAKQQIVYRNSFPHGGRQNRAWPDDKPEALLTRFTDAGYEVHVVATLRTEFCATESAVEFPHVFSRRKATHNFTEAIRRISTFAADYDLPIRYITYESVVHNTEALRRTLAELGLFWTPQFTDENAKYLID
ncbi:MAG TPA: hypothetical protein VH370_23695 [Humisphaera sp.]|jgi:hypothetical protein|nr:hypothetical protein [Humisphaera sp.]